MEKSARTSQKSGAIIKGTWIVKLSPNNTRCLQVLSIRVVFTVTTLQRLSYKTPALFLAGIHAKTGFLYSLSRISKPLFGP